MKRFFKALGIAVLIGLVVIVAGLATLYASFCGGHPHGMC